MRTCLSHPKAAVSQEERAVSWEVAVSVILSKKVYMYMVSETELFHCTVPQLFDKKAILHTVSNAGIYVLFK
jgi:hypothetical protein